MSKPELGTKRDCPECGARFYDLHKEPAHCPKCHHDFIPEALLKPRKTRAEEEVTPKEEAEEKAPEQETSFEQADDENKAAESNRKASLDEEEGDDGDDTVAGEDIPDIEAHREDYQIISWDLEPGDVYVFHGMTVHGSPGNSTQTRRRRGYAVRYVGDDVSYDDRPGVSKPLLNSELSTGGPLDSAQYPVIAF